MSYNLAVSFFRRGAALLLTLALTACSARTRRFIGYQFAGPAPAAECRADGPARWCVYTPKGPTTGDVVYFLHYATGDERSWNRLGLSRAFYDEYRRAGRPAPRVVTVSYGGYWLLTATPGLRQTVPLVDFDALRVRIEKSLGPIDRRFLWGMSQGGYSAAELVLSRPDSWAATALSCPALTASSPYEVPAHETASRGPEGRLLFTYRLAGDSVWKAENPLALIDAETTPPIWIEANTGDEFGYFKGARALADALRRSGHAARFVASPGGHCAIDARAVARFFMSVPPVFTRPNKEID
jgi:pimeloyl-ACP methyl ester carboxylesterase